MPSQSEHHHHHRRCGHHKEGEEHRHRRRKSRRSGSVVKNPEKPICDNRRTTTHGDVGTSKRHSFRSDPSSTLSTSVNPNNGRAHMRKPAAVEGKEKETINAERARRNSIHSVVAAHWAGKYSNKPLRISIPTQESIQTTKQSSKPPGGERPKKATAKASRKEQNSPLPTPHTESPQATTSKEQPEKQQPPGKDNRRSYSLLKALFASPPPHPPPVEKKITCLTCFSDDVPASKSAKLACSHRMCRPCLKRIFVMSVSDPQHMPPKCCTTDHIPLRHVEKLFDQKFKIQWNKKYQEYTAKNRIYCPAKGCGEWIKPSNIYLDTSNGPTGGRKFGKCSRCKTKVCALCNGKWHTGKECPKDEDTKRFVEIAKEEGWQRCFNCSAMVELREGCNHMTCRCTAEFCMICGAKWKTCECPWFNYEAVEADRMNHVDVQRARAMYVGDGQWRNPIRYQQEMDLRRRQEELDEYVARRLQDLFGPVQVPMPGRGGDEGGGDGDDGWDGNGNARRIPIVPMPPNPFFHGHFVAPFEDGEGEEESDGEVGVRAHTPPPPPERIQQYYHYRRPGLQNPNDGMPL
ncbi:hypothetical protein AJ79_01129 [Helicocarpus griseus UAMH5409]|uniref:RBR-type E3 ubiquitin transferase n=1 Tax=Helicocarpus griseus UAMH5409 TaxID=1447875 RepID=A0A2B7Y8V8_9EURO|nr:hypothetical protein AJ79_01129 [Helicocarpus griseus UAMH5409]